ncbi:MAG: hypothetical protein Q9168_005473 [Polycauliona sp. 1 TL-2023]
MPGLIHVKNASARRRVTFAPRRNRALVQTQEGAPSRQAAIDQSITCDSKHAVPLSIKTFPHSELQMATSEPRSNLDWTVSTVWPPIRDELETETSASQDKTVEQCLPLLLGYESSAVGHGQNPLASLDRAKHTKFLHRSLLPLPAGAVGLDASRPWMVYWALTALNILGEDVTPYRERYLGRNTTARVAGAG